MSNHKILSKSGITHILEGINRLEKQQSLNTSQLKDMIELLKAYQVLCIQKQDYNTAEDIKNRIQFLKGQELSFRKQILLIQDKENIQIVSSQGQKQIKQFQVVWDREIQQMIQKLSISESQFLQSQQKEKKQFIEALASQQIPKIKYSSFVLQKRRHLASLIKSRNYKEAEDVSIALKQLEIEENHKWNIKMDEKKMLKIEKLEKKQFCQMQAFQTKLQCLLNEKIKERDNKFDILLKQHRKRKIESSKPSKERIKNKLGILTESKIHFNSTRPN